MFQVLVMIGVLAAPVLAQPQAPASSDAKAQSGQNSQTPAGAPGTATPPQPLQPPQPVAPDAAVVTIHGLCPDGQGKSGQSDSCSLVLTRAQFETMVASINVSNQTYTEPALRSLASGFVTVLALADAGEKEGIEKDPRFQELMKVTRKRALADAYRRFLQEKYGNPAPEEIAEYYKQNIHQFEQVKIDRILVPKVNPKRSQENRAEFEKKARQLAGEIRERAARGEDMNSLQIEAYKSLGLVDSQPPQVEVNTSRKGVLLPAVEQKINALKPGEVTPVEAEPSGFNIYKLRARNTVPLETAKAQIVRELSQKNIDAAMKAVTSRVHADFNEDFFKPHTTGPAQKPRLPSGTAQER
ncbi:MAG: peptidyl-prolyl cis-trans isomerase [Acidobacteriia bacterium]|nr:peptidyl-prolyl cis-trans isomerase [Terriglobia bacterium]